jgi:hypothetical protein
LIRIGVSLFHYFSVLGPSHEICWSDIRANEKKSRVPFGSRE